MPQRRSAVEGHQDQKIRFSSHTIQIYRPLLPCVFHVLVAVRLGPSPEESGQNRELPRMDVSKNLAELAEWEEIHGVPLILEGRGLRPWIPPQPPPSSTPDDATAAVRVPRPKPKLPPATAAAALPVPRPKLAWAVSGRKRSQAS